MNLKMHIKLMCIFEGVYIYTMYTYIIYAFHISSKYACEVHNYYKICNHFFFRPFLTRLYL